MTDRFRYSHGRGRGQFRQTRRFGFEHRFTGAGIELDEIVAFAVTHPPSLIDTTAADRLSAANAKWRGGRYADLLPQGGP